MKDLTVIEPIEGEVITPEEWDKKQSDKNAWLLACRTINPFFCAPPVSVAPQVSWKTKLAEIINSITERL